MKIRADFTNRCILKKIHNLLKIKKIKILQFRLIFRIFSNFCINNCQFAELDIFSPIFKDLIILEKLWYEKSNSAAALRKRCHHQSEVYSTESLVTRIKVVLLIIACLMYSAAINADIAGERSYERPDDAPIQSDISKDRDWYEQALHGVSPPYPHSLKFLESQGNWYTPFVHPGMPNRYNIRNW